MGTRHDQHLSSRHHPGRVVGAGPAGLTPAVTPAEAGIDFVLLDRLAEGANTSRAAVVHARTLEVLEEVGVARELVATGLRLTRIATARGSRRALGSSSSTTISWSGSSTRDAVLPLLGRLPAFRRRLAREPAEPDYR